MRLMLVDDDTVLIKGLKRTLEALGHVVSACYDGAKALYEITATSPDMVILDVMLPGKDGLTVLREIRERFPDLPVIMLTAKAEDIDKVLGLELGADDYLAKPFSVRELEARIKAVARRAGSSPKAQVRKGDLLVDLRGRRVWRSGRELDLTPKEFDVLALLLRHQGMVMTREQILRDCWGFDFVGDSRAVDILISRLREKVEDDPKNPRLILTKRGTGYYCE
ncbi:MAG TPA: response regulator transcription factor [Firmicutes bacterium]|nr:response regulator transcription factor [Candidatus Fermentithermobacillaceae bacterium]